MTPAAAAADGAKSTNRRCNAAPTVPKMDRGSSFFQSIVVS